MEDGKYYAIIVVSNSQLSIEIRHFRLKTSHPISSGLTIIVTYSRRTVKAVVLAFRGCTRARRLMSFPVGGRCGILSGMP